MNIKLSGDGTAKIQETLQVKKLNEISHIRGDFLYVYDKSNYAKMLLKWNSLTIDGEPQEIQGFESQGSDFSMKIPLQSGRDPEILTIQNESEVFGLVTPFT